MDGSASKPCSTTRGIGLVKAAVNLYRNRNIADVNSPSLKKNFSTGYEDKVVASQIQRFVTQKLPSIQSAVWWTSSVEKVIMLYFLWMTTRLGGTPTMELMIVARKIVPKLQLEHGLSVDRVYTGSFMTSLDMAGLLPQLLAISLFLL
ncbi:uncharacterized protein [Glycine max]|nr:uncharacterized protein LOC100783453 isoform X2 [Glycine max]